MPTTKDWEKEFDEKFIQPAERRYKSAVNDHAAPLRQALENLLEVKAFIAQVEQQAEARVRKEEKESKDGAYHERNMLVAALTKLFPAYLARHDYNDKDWEDDWRWIVYIEIPTKVKRVSGDQHNYVPQSKWFETRVEQISWHIHDSEVGLFNHLEVKENNWDGHNTQRKYERLQALASLSSNDHE